MGSTILRSECMTTFSVVSARAGGGPSARHQKSETVRHATTRRRMDVMDILLERIPGDRTTRAGGLRCPSTCRWSREDHTALRLVNAADAIIPIHVRADRAPPRSTRCPRCADTIHDQLKSLRMADDVAVAYRIWKPGRSRRL